MGKRYYCDYCDRSFKDEVSSRKKHLESLNHKQAKKQYYLRVRDLRDLVQEERAKGTCRRYFANKCPFNDNCLYSHYSEDELNQFSQQVEEYEKERLKSKVKIKSVEEWLNKRSLKKSGLSVNEGSSIQPEILHLQDSSLHLPPSLKPLKEFNLKNIELAEWG